MDLATTFWFGLRFDLAGLCLLNIPVILLSLIPSMRPGFFQFERWLFVILNMLGILATVNDFELFVFTGKRLSVDLFSLGSDILDQLPQLAVYYWYFPVTTLFLAYMVYYTDKRFVGHSGRATRPIAFLLGTLVFLGAVFVAIRGGLQSKSIDVQSAFTQGKNELGHLVMNTPYHFFRTLKNNSLERMTFFTEDSLARAIIKEHRDIGPHHLPAQRGKRNIVLLIMESFSLEYVEEGFTPFLSELIKESAFFPYHLANGRRSIEVLPSVLCALPSLMATPISKSIFQSNNFTCIPKLLKEAGHSTAFFHGGNRGTMGFESYTLSHGFESYFSREDYPLESDFDGTWGIYDGPFLQYSLGEISRLKTPFFVGIFTLSSHQPYSVPLNLKGQFPKGHLEIHESIGYSDYALRKFFESAKKLPWYKDTIFIITADHTSKLSSKKFQNSIGHYRVPLVIHDPQKTLSLPTNKVTHHSDIPRTVADLAQIKAEKLPATSVSLFAADSGRAINFIDNREYQLVGLSEVLTWSKNEGQKSHIYDWETGDFREKNNSQDPLLKAYLQYFINGLLTNNLSID
jgi:phosphoglycerol transferase MdoB-like AlkP superfamily enzyme